MTRSLTLTSFVVKHLLRVETLLITLLSLRTGPVGAPSRAPLHYLAPPGKLLDRVCRPH
jgi:hypothetical protein